ncbi:MAG: DMT family transporter, partial [Pseudomonadota bacterium]
PNSAVAAFGVIVAAIVLSDERMTWRKGLGTVIGFSGVLIAIGPEALRDFDLRSLAQIAVLGGALSYAFASVWARLHLGDLPPALAAFGMLSASSLMILPLTFAMEGVPTLALEWSTWAAIGYYSLGATALAYLVFYRVLAMAGAANLMLVTLLLTPIAIALGAIFLDEAIGAGALLGCAVLGFGLVVMDGRLFKLLHRRAIAR